MKLSPTRWLRSLLLLLVLGFALIQLIPYGRDHTNPPVTAGITWDSPRTEELMRGACYDCHSNETVWPFYANIAPVSWLLAKDVQEGRSRLNFSELTNEKGALWAGELREVISEGWMPPFQYTIMHANSRLSAAEKQELLDGISNSLH